MAKPKQSQVELDEDLEDEDDEPEYDDEQPLFEADEAGR